MWRLLKLDFLDIVFERALILKKMNPLETYQLLLSSIKVVFKQSDYEEILIFKVIFRINYSKKTQYTSYIFTRHNQDLGWHNYDSIKNQIHVHYRLFIYKVLDISVGIVLSYNPNLKYNHIKHWILLLIKFRV